MNFKGKNNEKTIYHEYCVVGSVNPNDGKRTNFICLYGGANKSANPGAILSVDPLTGVSTVLGTPVAGVGLPGLAANESGQLFAVTSNHLGNAQLIEVDPGTGALLNIVGDLTYLGNPDSLNDIAFQPGTGTLFGSATGNLSLGFNDLVTINTSDATITRIGEMIQSRGGYMAITFSPAGTLYGHATSSGNLYTYDPATAALLTTTATSIGSNSGVLGMSVDPVSGAIFLSECCNGPEPWDDIYTLDPGTGTVTFIGAGSSVDVIQGLTFAGDSPIQFPAVAIPTINQWGMVIIFVLFLVFGVAILRRSAV